MSPPWWTEPCSPKVGPVPRGLRGRSASLPAPDSVSLMANAEAKSCSLPCRHPHRGRAPSMGRKCRRWGPLAVSPEFREEHGFPPQAPSKRGELCFFFFIHASYPQPGLPSWRSPRRSAVTRALLGCGRPHTSRDAEVTLWCVHFWGSDCSEGKGKPIFSLHLCSFPSCVHPITTVASTVMCLKCFSEARQLKTPQNGHQDLCPFRPSVGRPCWRAEHMRPPVWRPCGTMNGKAASQGHALHLPTHEQWPPCAHLPSISHMSFRGCWGLSVAEASGGSRQGSEVSWQVGPPCSQVGTGVGGQEPLG